MKFRKFVKETIEATRNEPFWKFLLMTALVSLILILLTFCAQPSEIDDNYHYMNLGKALYQGDGFVRLDTPGHPPEDIVTPGYPLILAGIMKLAGNAKPLIAMKLFSTLCYWLSVLIAVTVFVKFMNCNRWVAFLFAVFMSITQFMIYYASYVLTEAPFLFFSTLTVFLILLYERDRKDLFFYLATLSVVAGIYIRLPGAPLAVAVFFWLVLRKDYKKAFIFAAIVGILVGAWVVPKILSGRFLYGGQFVVTESIAIESARTQSHFSRYFYNFGHYLFVSFPRLIFPFISLYPAREFILSRSWFEIALGIPIFFFLILGSILGLKKKETAFPYFYFLSYFVIICYFGSVGIRYMTYVFPWFILAFISGFSSIYRRFEKKRIVKIFITIIPFIIVLLAIPSSYKVIIETSATRRLAHRGIKPPLALVVMNRYRNQVELHRLYHACEWIRTNLPEDAVIMAPQQRTVYYYSERACLSPKYWESILSRQGLVRDRELKETEIDSMWLWALDNGLTHVVIDPIYMVTRNYLKPALARYQDCITPIYETDEPKSRVFEIDTTCLREFLTTNSKAEIDKILHEVVRLKEKEDADSLSSLLERYERSDKAIEGICKYLSYYIYLMEFDELLKLFESAQTLYPDNPILWFNWGIEHNRMQLLSISVPAFEKALEYGADSADCYNNLGVAMTIQKDSPKAEVYFEKAMAHAPDDHVVLKNRLANLISTRDISKADSLLEWATFREDVDDEYVAAVKAMVETFERWKKSLGIE